LQDQLRHSYFHLLELGQSLADFGKAIKLLGACEGDSLEKVFSEVGSKSEMLSIKLQREVINRLRIIALCIKYHLAIDVSASVTQ
jgi:hypothetical protein